MYHLVRFEAVDWKGIEAQEIVPRGRSAVISGQNETGKTSLADAIFCWLTGGSLADFIRNGADKALLEGELVGPGGPMRVKRIVKKGGGSKLDIRGPDGKPPEGGAVELLDRLVGAGIALRPMKLYDLPEKELRDKLLECLGESVAAEEAEEKAAYDERRDTKRDLAQAEAEVETLLRKGAGTAPEKALDKGEALKRVEVADHRVRNEAARVAAIKRAEEMVEQKRAEFERVVRELDEAEAAAKVLRQTEEDPGAEKDAAAAREALANIGEHNTKAALREQYVAARTKARGLEAKVGELEKRVEDARAAKGKKLGEAAARSGFPALVFGDDGCTLEGVPLREVNFARRVEFAVAIGTVNRKPDSVSLAIIDAATELDDETTERLSTWAQQQDVQIIFFKVASGVRVLTIEVLEPDAAA